MATLFYLYKERCKQLKEVGSLNGLDHDYAVYGTYSYFKDLMNESEFKHCLSINQNRSKKRKRCSDNYFKIDVLGKLTGAQMVFGTITLNNEFMKLNFKNQQKIIERYLKRHYFYVLKNADYGSKTDRLHYHFIGLTFDELIDTGKKSHKGRKMYNINNDVFNWGFVPNLEIIPYDMKDKKRLSNYIVKLNNHSNKLSVKRTKLSILKNKNYLKKYCTLSDVIL